MALHVWISGRVQGVYYRESTKEQAERLGVRGWIKNLKDGRVEAVFDGPASAVADLLDWCADGPPNAKVTDIEAETDEGSFADFRVLR